MNIYVGNLDWNTTEAELREAFEAFGEVSSATIVKDKFTERSRGFGFVEMPNDEQAQAAIDGLNGTTMGARELTVNVARPKEDRGPRRERRPGGGRQGGRGGDRRFQDQRGDRGGERNDRDRW